MSERWIRRPQGSNWGDFGPDDEYGRLNLLTPAKVLEGLAEVREGRTFCLSLPLDLPGGSAVLSRRHPPRRFATKRDGRPNYNFRVGEENGLWTDVASDDAVLLHTQYSTQWDALSHVGSLFDSGDGQLRPTYYNGFRGELDVVGPPNQLASECGFEGVEARRLGIERMAERCVQGRAVLVDLHAHYGRERKLVGYAELMHVCRADEVQIEKGDMVVFHTGLTEMIVEMRGSPDGQLLHRSCPVLNGADERLLEWITDSGIAIVVADNFAVEQFPPPPATKRGAALPLHEHCLFKLGIHLGELWYVTELASWLREHGRSRFLLTAPPLRLTGAVGSPVTPVATV